jgi:hypothetical protein
MLTEDDIVNLFYPSSSQGPLELPVSIFSNSSLSALETICKYLKEDKGLRYSAIAQMLNRDQRTIWVTYNNSCKKQADRLCITDCDKSIPVSVFQDRNRSVLESIVVYLKDKYNLRYSEIAALIGRDERNIWAAYNKKERVPSQ